jgi:hypothetical protein
VVAVAAEKKAETTKHIPSLKPQVGEYLVQTKPLKRRGSPVQVQEH